MISVRTVTSLVFFSMLLASASAGAQTIRLTLTADDFVVTPVFNVVPLFSFDIEIDAPLAPGNYTNPPLVSVVYTVTGELRDTPSGFPAFALEREISGEEFYAQGSSLSFTIRPEAVLVDGIQAAELAGDDTVFTFDGREIGNGRFHPALLELRADGSGRLLNSNNVITLEPMAAVDFGDEYVTSLAFDPGNLTLMTEIPDVDDDPAGAFSQVGGGPLSPVFVLLLLVLRHVRARHQGIRLPW